MIRKKFIRLSRVIQRLLSAQPVYANISYLTPNHRLEKRRILVTGGSRGIGYAIAKRCVSEGAYVVITGRDEKNLAKVASEFNGYKVFNMYDITQMKNTFCAIDEEFGPFDSLICNAGISLHESSFEAVTSEGFDRQFTTNLKGNYFLAQQFLKQLTSKNLLFISSETADMCCEIPYGLTKNAVNSLVGALSRHYYRSGKRINAIAPGLTLTDMVKDRDTCDDDISYPNSSGRYFLPDEIAEVAVFLLSDASKCISGEIIHTNAGNHLRTQASQY